MSKDKLVILPEKARRTLNNRISLINYELKTPLAETPHGVYVSQDLKECIDDVYSIARQVIGRAIMLAPLSRLLQNHKEAIVNGYKSLWEQKTPSQFKSTVEEWLFDVQEAMAATQIVGKRTSVMDVSILDLDYSPIVAEEVLEKIPKPVRIDIENAEVCYHLSKRLEEIGNRPIFETVAMYLRKALASVIVSRFKRAKKEDQLYDENHQMVHLKKMIRLARNEKFFTGSLFKEITEIRCVGDVAVHDPFIKVTESDVKPAFRLISLALRRLFSDIKQ